MCCNRVSLSSGGLMLRIAAHRSMILFDCSIIGPVWWIKVKDPLCGPAFIRTTSMSISACWSFSIISPLINSLRPFRFLVIPKVAGLLYERESRPQKPQKGTNRTTTVCGKTLPSLFLVSNWFCSFSHFWQYRYKVPSPCFCKWISNAGIEPPYTGIKSQLVVFVDFFLHIAIENIETCLFSISSSRIRYYADVTVLSVSYVGILEVDAVYPRESVLVGTEYVLEHHLYCIW